MVQRLGQKSLILIFKSVSGAENLFQLGGDLTKKVSSSLFAESLRVICLEGTPSRFSFCGELARMGEAGERKILGLVQLFERLQYPV